MSMACVCASDVNDTQVASENDAGIELTATENDLNAIEDNASDYDEIMSAGDDGHAGVEDSKDIGNMIGERPNSKLAASNTDEHILKEGASSLDQLYVDVTWYNKPKLDLECNYSYMGGSDLSTGVLVDRDVIIDGHGITIDGGKTAKIFYVDNAKVTFQNINFINCYDEINIRTQYCLISLTHPAITLLLV